MRSAQRLVSLLCLVLLALSSCVDESAPGNGGGDERSDNLFASCADYTKSSPKLAAAIACTLSDDAGAPRNVYASTKEVYGETETDAPAYWAYWHQVREGAPMLVKPSNVTCKLDIDARNTLLMVSPDSNPFQDTFTINWKTEAIGKLVNAQHVLQHEVDGLATTLAISLSQDRTSVSQLEITQEFQGETRTVSCMNTRTRLGRFRVTPAERSCQEAAGCAGSTAVDCANEFEDDSDRALVCVDEHATCQSDCFDLHRDPRFKE